MPLYDFKCECVDCSYIFESFEKMNVKEIKCPKCGEKAQRQITPTRLKFTEPWRPLGKRIY